MYVSPDLASLLFLLSCILFLPYLECAAVSPAQDVVTACRLSEWQKLWENDSCHLGTWCAYFFQVIGSVQNLNMQFLLHKAFWYFQKRNMTETIFCLPLFCPCWVYFMCHFMLFFFSVHHFRSSICYSVCASESYTREWIGVLSYSICCASYSRCIAQWQPLFPNEHENPSQALSFCLGGMRNFWKLSFETDNMIISFCTHYWNSRIPLKCK